MERHRHGMSHQEIKEVADTEKSYQWLHTAGVTDSTEELIMGAVRPRVQVQ